jgi:hypothetical protein
MLRQWQDELEAKFGLSFVIVDREHLAALRRERGFSANPWTAGSLFIISHSVLVDDTYVAGLRDALGEFRPRAMMILDEAHHATPASGARYAVDSQLTKACGTRRDASSIGSCCRPHRTTGTPIRFRLSWRFSTRSASRAAFRCVRASSTQ